jgi:hypothetical protein
MQDKAGKRLLAGLQVKILGHGASKDVGRTDRA